MGLKKSQGVEIDEGEWRGRRVQNSVQGFDFEINVDSGSRKCRAARLMLEARECVGRLFSLPVRACGGLSRGVGVVRHTVFAGHTHSLLAPDLQWALEVFQAGKKKVRLDT